MVGRLELDADLQVARTRLGGADRHQELRLGEENEVPVLPRALAVPEVEEAAHGAPKLAGRDGERIDPGELPGGVVTALLPGEELGVEDREAGGGPGELHALEEHPVDRERIASPARVHLDRRAHVAEGSAQGGNGDAERAQADHRRVLQVEPGPSLEEVETGLVGEVEEEEVAAVAPGAEMLEGGGPVRLALAGAAEGGHQLRIRHRDAVPLRGGRPGGEAEEEERGERAAEV